MCSHVIAYYYFLVPCLCCSCSRLWLSSFRIVILKIEFSYIFIIFSKGKYVLETYEILTTYLRYEFENKVCGLLSLVSKQ